MCWKNGAVRVCRSSPSPYSAARAERSRAGIRCGGMRQAVLSDINIFNFSAQKKSAVPRLFFTTCRAGNDYMACRNDYMAYRKSCHRDSFTPERASGYEERRFLPPFPLLWYKDNTFSRQKQIVLKSRLASKAAFRPCRQAEKQTADGTGLHSSLSVRRPVLSGLRPCGPELSVSRI